MIHPSDVLPKCCHDFETYSEADLKKVGAWVYAEHPSTDIICMSYKIGAGPTKLWIPDGSCLDFPQEIIDHIAAGGIMEAHNAGFERAIWRHILVKRYGLVMPRRWVDTMAVCAYRSLPQKLDDVGKVLNLKLQKDPRGKQLIAKLCKPQKPTKKKPNPWRNTDHELLQELYRYCIRDCDTEYELSLRVGELPMPEYRLWVLDQKINDRGVYIDTSAVAAARAVVVKVEAKLTKELSEITGGAVNSHDELDRIHEWMGANDYHLPDLTADTLDEALKGGMAPIPSPVVRRVIEIRRALARASIRKLVAFHLQTAADGRAHGQLQYHGAGTGRWAGRGIQFHNFPRGTIEDMETLIELIRYEDPEILELFFGDVMDTIASSLRGMLIATPGMVMYVSDFSAIEARVAAWLALEEWKLEAFREIDKGRGYKGAKDMYCATASVVFKRPIIDKKQHPKERQVGKVAELALGYQGAVNAWRKMDPDEREKSDEEILEYVKTWRAANPNIVALWYGLEEAAIAAVETGRPHRYSYVAFEVVNDKAGKWLACILPNGRRLWYFNPSVATVPTKRKDGSVWMKKQLNYEGRDNKRGGRWSLVTTYGGMLTENCVQAISRDLMTEAMERVEAAGYPIILTVHDEIIAETPVDFGSLPEYNALMSVVPTWANGCPIEVAGWRGTRYKKEG